MDEGAEVEKVWGERIRIRGAACPRVFAAELISSGRPSLTLGSISRNLGLSQKAGVDKLCQSALLSIVA